MTIEPALERSTPEAQGVASSAVLAFLAASAERGLGLHSLMLLRHGRVVAEGWWRPYAPERPHMLFSLSKSFTSTAIGLAVAEGRMSVDDFVLPFFPDDAPSEVSENLAAMRVRHLLSMTTGHADDTTETFGSRTDGNWAKAFLAAPVTHEPGTHFLYNSGASYMLSAIIQALTGMTVLDYLGPRLTEPLGIVGATWETCPRGINAGGWGLSATTEAVARFGQLYLQKGEWEGRQLLPEAWVTEATRWQVSNAPNPASDWEQGYGYQFWRCRHDAYRGDGAFGQYCLVLPDQDAVLAITGGVADMQIPLDLVWEHLLPHMGGVLADDAVASDELRRSLSHLQLATPAGQYPSSATAGRVSGRTYRFEANDERIDSLRLDFAAVSAVMTVRDKHGEQRIACGTDDWHEGTVVLPSGSRPVLLAHTDQPLVAARGTWTADDTYVVTLCFVETPFVATITCRFIDNHMLYDYRVNVGFGPTTYPQLIGRSG